MTDEYSDAIDRRRFVALTGVAGAAALAGCGGGGGETATETPTESSGGGGGNETDTPTESGDGGGSETGSGTQVYDAKSFDFINQIVPANAQFNPFNPTNYTPTPPNYLFDDYVKFDYANGEFVPYAISDWEMGDSTFQISIRDGLTWENGDPVTAHDIVVQLRLQRTVGNPVWDYTESVEAADDSTVVLHFSETPNPYIVKHQVFNNAVDVKASKYEEYVGDSEGIAQFSDQDPVASGPWTFESAGQQQMTLSRRDDHPDSGNINFSNVGLRFIEGNQSLQQALMSGDLDVAHNLFVPPRVVANFPDSVLEARIPNKWGLGLVFNHDKPHVGQRPVRQAIAHAINREQVVRNAGPRTKATPEILTPIPTDDQDRWLGDAMDSFRSYGKGSANQDRVDQLMSGAGYSMDGGTWKDDNGNAVSLPLLVPAGWSDWVSGVQTAADQLSSAGFDAAVNARSYGSLGGQAWTQGNFTVSAFYWLPGGPRSSFPYFGLEHQLVMSAGTVQYNYPDQVTVPEREGSGEFTTTPADRLSTLSTTTNADDTQSIIHEQAWVANVDLPMLPLTEKLIQVWFTGDDWNVPPEGSEKYQVTTPAFWLPRQGDLSYKGD